jgi:UPF0755 protein
MRRLQPLHRQFYGKLVEWMKGSLKLIQTSLPGMVSGSVRIFGQVYAALRNSARWKKLLALSLAGLLVLTLWTKHFYTLYLGPDVTRSYLLFIHEKDNIDKIASLLDDNGCLKKVDAFKKLARFKDYDKNIKPGAYQLQAGWSLNTLINVLKSGAQTPVMVTFNNVRTREDLAGKLSKQLQCDSLSFLLAFKNDSNAIRNGFKPETFPALFIPNSYSLFWTTSPSGFLARMKREYDSFWNEARKLKASAIGLKADEVATLASIVQEESNKNDEKPLIAAFTSTGCTKNGHCKPTRRSVMPWGISPSSEYLPRNCR